MTWKAQIQRSRITRSEIPHLPDYELRGEGVQAFRIALNVHDEEHAAKEKEAVIGTGGG